MSSMHNLFDISMKYFFEIFIILCSEFFSFTIIAKVCSCFLSCLSIKISQRMRAMKLFSSLMFSSFLMNVRVLYCFFVSNILIIFHVDLFSSFIFIAIRSMISNYFFNRSSNDACILILSFVYCFVSKFFS